MTVFVNTKINYEVYPFNARTGVQFWSALNKTGSLKINIFVNTYFERKINDIIIHTVIKIYLKFSI